MWEHPEQVGASRRKQSRPQSPRSSSPPPPTMSSSCHRMQKLPWVLQHTMVTAMVAGGRQGIHSWGGQCWPHLGGSGLCLGMQRLLGKGDHG